MIAHYLEPDMIVLSIRSANQKSVPARNDLCKSGGENTQKKQDMADKSCTVDCELESNSINTIVIFYPSIIFFLRIFGSSFFYK